MPVLQAIQVRDRGSTPRRLAKAMTASKRAAWYDTAVEFHQSYRDKRFTEEHAREAGYTKRKGENLARDSKAFRRSYTGQKLRIHGHTRPLEFSKETRQAVRQAAISSTTKSGKASYRGARKFNFRHPKSRVRMSEEFKRITPQETQQLADFFDRRLDFHLAQQDR